MIHLFKRSKITIDSFTYHPGIVDQFPIAKASEFYPQWWKTLPKELPAITRDGVPFPMATMKTCEGFIRNYYNSFILPMWSDLSLITRADGTWTYLYSATEYMPTIVEHDGATHDNALSKYLALKILTPWLMQEKSGIKFHLTSPVWSNVNKINEFTTLPGTVDFKHQNTINNIMLLNKRRNEIHWESGDAFMHVIPLTEKDVTVKCHLVTKQEYDDLYLAKMYRSSFVSTYMKKKSRCPFHGGKSNE